MFLMVGQVASAAAVLAAGGALGGPLLVAAGGLVVVLAILLVFLMVLRNGGNARKTARGIGYDDRRGSYGPQRDAMMPPDMQRGGPPQGWAPGNEYGSEYPPASGGWAGYGNQMGSAAAPSQGAWGQPAGPSWGPPMTQPQGGWEQPAPASATPTAAQWGQQQNAWGQQQPPSQDWGTPAGNGYGQPGAPSWGQPAEPSAANAWGQQQQQQQQQQPAGAAYAGPSGGLATPAGWGPSAQGAAPAAQGWGAPPATAIPPQQQDWGGAMGQPGGMPQYGQPYGQMMPATAGRTAVLQVAQGKEPGRTFDLRKERITIGRSRESDIFLEDLAVSRQHTTINRDPHGRYICRDEGSANGTFVNDEKIIERPLQEGDRVQIGQTVLVFAQR